MPSKANSPSCSKNASQWRKKCARAQNYAQSLGEFSGDPARSTETAEVNALSITGNHIDIDSSSGRGLAFTNHFDFVTFNGTTISNNTVESGLAALFAGAATDSFRFEAPTISGNEFTGFLNSYNLFNADVSGNTFNSITVLGLDGSSVTGNTFNVDNAYGLGLWGDDFGTNVSQNTAIENNIFNYNDAAISASSTGGVALRAGVDTSTITFVSNTFNDGGFAAIPAAAVIVRGTSGDDMIDAPDFLATSGLPATAEIRFEAGDGNDEITVDLSENVIVDGGDGTDTAIFADGTDPADIVDTLDQFTSVEVIRIGDAGPGATYFVAEGMSIQAAVDAAADGDTIIVSEGTYQEQVLIDGFTGLNIVADGDVTVLAPDDVEQNATSGSGRAINAVISVVDSSDVVLDGLTVDGDGRANTIDGTNPNYVGVSYRNASGGLEDVDITGVRDPYPGGETVDGFDIVSGNQRGIGLQVDNDTLMAFSMTGGSISDFQKNATSFNRAALNVTGVTVTGGGAQPINAQNGFQAINSTGTISGNIVTKIGYAGPSNVSSGLILAFDNTDLAISNNTLTGLNDIEAGAKMFGVYVAGADGGSVTGNTVSEVDFGVIVLGDVTPNSVDVNSNTVTETTEGTTSTGVYFVPTAANAVPHNVAGSDLGDFLAGGAANDVINGLGGDDTTIATAGNDTINGGDGTDTYDVSTAGSGGAFVDLHTGVAFSSATGFDSLTSIERLVGSDGDDAFFGDAADNIFVASGGTDIVDGRGGSDSFDASAATTAVTADLGAGTVSGAFDATLTSIENISTGSGDDVVTGSAADNLIETGDGDDQITLVGGNDTVDGGAGSDIVNFSGGIGDYTIDIAAGTATSTATSDTVSFENVEELRFNDNSIFIVQPGQSIQAAIDAAGTGDTIYVAAGTHVLPAQLNVDKGVELVGAGEDLTTIETAATNWGILVDADGARLAEFSVDASATSIYGVKVQAPDTNVDVPLNGFDIENVTISGAGRTELDFNNVDGATVTGVTLDGLGTSGNGMSLTASSNAVITDLTTTGNDWGGVAIYPDTSVPAWTDGSDNITFAGTFNQSEANPIYIQESVPGTATNLNFNHLSEVFLVKNDTFRADGAEFTFVFGTEAEATTFALGLATPLDSVVTGPESTTLTDTSLGDTFIVVPGMSIQAAVDAASAGDTIEVAAGTYDEDVTVPIGITLEGANAGIAGTGTRGAETVIEGRITVDGDDVTIDGFSFDIDASGAGGGQGVVTLNGANGTLTNAVMEQDTDNGTVPNAVQITGEDNTVSDSLIDRSGAIGSGALGNPAIRSSGADRVTISDNTLIQGIIGIVTGNGTTPGLVLTGNTITAAAPNSDSVFITGPGFGPLPNGFDPLSGTIDLTGTTFTTSDGLQIRGTAQADDFAGFETAGNDWFMGNDGDDSFTGSAGDDTLDGGAGVNTVTYAAQSSAVFANLTNGTAFGSGIGSDSLIDIQNLTGGSGNDAIFGSALANVIDSGAGNDFVQGGAGADSIIGGDGDDTLEGNAGRDTIDGGQGADEIYGGDANDMIFGGSGNDFIDAGAQNDYVTGQSGDDTILGGLGNDTLIGGGGDDSISGGEGADELRGSDGNDTIEGDLGNDTLFGGQGDDLLLGGDSNDTLYGNQGADTLEGGAGADMLYGGFDADTFRFNSATEIGGFGTGLPQDRIMDFEQGLDVIDLSPIDALTTVAGNQAFTFIGTAAHTGAGATLRYVNTATDTIIYGDIDADGAGDFGLRVDGVFTLTADDFIL